MQVRNATAQDLPAIRAIQEASPEASQWEPSCVDESVLVAEEGAHVAGFLVWREVAPGESEILNLAVDPPFRRRGVARNLLSGLASRTVFLEVRESNHAARGLYRAAGFLEVGTRRNYYQNPIEYAIVMRWQS